MKEMDYKYAYAVRRLAGDNDFKIFLNYWSDTLVELREQNGATRCETDVRWNQGKDQMLSEIFQSLKDADELVKTSSGGDEINK
jgi:hypothetical protein